MISIGLSFYNAQSTLIYALRSIFAQSFQDFELILINDGSTDKSLDIVKKIDDPRVKVISDDKKLGLAARLNQIASIAKGEYLARMDADDIMFPNRLKVQHNFLKKNSEYDLVGSWLICIDSKNIPASLRSAPERPESFYQIFKGGVLYHPSILGRTNWFNKNQYNIKCKNIEDFELWTRCSKKINIYNICEPLLFYRQHNFYPWNKYKDRSKLAQKIISIHGPVTIGRSKTLLLILRRKVIETVYMSLNYLGLWKITYKLHTISLSDDVISYYNNIICQIGDTIIPGID